MDEDLGARLRRLRVAAGLTQTQLAGEELSPSYVSLIESGRRRPTHEVATTLAGRLDVSVVLLLEGREPASTAAAALQLDMAGLSLLDGRAMEAGAQFRSLLDDPDFPDSMRDDAALGLSRALEQLGDLDAAIAELSGLFDRALAGTCSLPVTTLAIRLCRCSLDVGDLHRATDVGERGLALAAERGLVGSEDHLRLAATVMAAYFERGDVAHAAALADRWLPVAEQHGSRTGQGSIYWNAAIVAEARGDIDQAARYSSRALGHLSEGEDTRDLSRLRVACAWLWLRQDEPQLERALRELERAQPDLDRWGSTVDLAHCSMARSQAALLAGEAGVAVDQARRALDHLAPRSSIETCQALITLGDALQAVGDAAGALDSYRTAAVELGELSTGRSAAECWRAVGDRLMQHEAVREAAHAYSSALHQAGVRPSVTSLERVVDVVG